MVPGAPRSWEVVERLDRKRSVIFLVRLVTGAGPIDAYYKTDIGRPHESVPNVARREAISQGLTRAARLTDKLIDSGRGRGIGAARILAADPASQTVVTAAVAGSSLHGGRLPPVSREERNRQRTAFETVGAAARLVEEAGAADLAATPARDVVLWDLLEFRLGASVPMLGPRLAHQVERRLESLADELSTGTAAYVHGDLSRGNILADEVGINLIDFRWVARPRTFDVSHLTYRLEYELPMPDPWRRELVRLVIAGYGVPSLTESPLWQMNRLQHLLGLTSRQGRRGDSLRKRRGRSELARLASA